MKKILVVLLLLLFLFTIIWYYLSQKYPTTSPLKSSRYTLEHIFKPHKNMTAETMGFLPYWEVDKVEDVRLDLLTEINYFALRVDPRGDIVQEVEGETDPGWREWNNQKIKDLIARAQIMGSKFSVTFVSQRNSTIETILEKPDIQKRLIANILEQVKSRNLDGVNIDLEYQNNCTPHNKSAQGHKNASNSSEKAELCKIPRLQKQFTEFSKSLRNNLKSQSPTISLFVSMMPRAERTPDIFDFPTLVPVYDKFIGMSYDYAGQANEIADATAPMTGFKENKFFFDVTTTYEDFLKVIPKDKILMGVPYYGWDWAVQSGSRIQSKVLTGDNSYAAVVSYARAKEMKELKKSQCEFDEIALQPWCWYTKDQTDHQVWFENDKSIGIKYDFAKNHRLGGIAIWVLGYDKNYTDLWDMLSNKFASH